MVAMLLDINEMIEPIQATAFQHAVAKRIATIEQEYTARLENILEAINELQIDTEEADSYHAKGLNE